LTGRSPSWAALAALLCAGSVLAWALPSAWLDWQPQRGLAQPWRAYSAAFVHWSPLHLFTNLLAAAVVGAYGWAAELPLRATLAWAGAWPLTHLGLWLRPELAHYGGLSGVLHAGVAITTLWLLWTGGPGLARRRSIGAAVAMGLVIKLATETPWGPALQRSTEWDIAVVPLAHTTGAAAGLLCAALALAWGRRKAGA
jgi:rhomboid family GlyGly-CTERM serine protease